MTNFTSAQPTADPADPHRSVPAAPTPAYQRPTLTHIGAWQRTTLALSIPIKLGGNDAMFPIYGGDQP